MQVVININDGTYEAIKNEYCALPPQKGLKKVLWDAVKDGTPLPKGHGDLIDINNIDVIELEDSTHIIKHEKGDEVDVYISAPIIIKADREVEE